MHSHLRTTRGTLLPKIAPFSPLIGYCIYGMTGNVRTREKILIIVGGLCCVKVFITCYRANTTTPTTYKLQHVALQLRTLLHKCWSTCVPCGSFLLQLHWPEHVITTRAARTTMDPIGAMRKTMYVTTAMR